MERIDDLQINGLRLVQNPELFCFGCDAVELSNFAGELSGKRVLNFCDLGAGNGIISVLLAGKFGHNVTAVEIQSECANLITKNIALNNLDNKINVVNIGMQQFANERALSISRAQGAVCYDSVVCNPPYRKSGSGERQKASAVQIARHELEVTFAEVAESAAKLLSNGGKFYLIHICERMAEVICQLKKVSLEPKVLQVLTPCDGKAPHIFMMQCIKGGNEGLNILPQRNVRL